MRYHIPMIQFFLSKRIAASFLRRCILLILCLTGNTAADVFVRDDIITTPSPDAFSVCYGHTCAEVVELKLERDQWERIRVLFLSPPDKRRGGACPNCTGHRDDGDHDRRAGEYGQRQGG